MIVSHKYQFIFIKTKKTAGTSIEIALSKFCGPEDVITPISEEDEKLRRQAGGRGPQNHLVPFKDYTRQHWVGLLKERRRKNNFYNHISAREVRDKVGARVWKDYYKFCFERNPWDRLISLYYWRCQSEPRPTIAEFLATDAPRILIRGGRDLYTIDGQVAVDHLGRFENLTAEMESIRVHLGIPAPLELPRAKSRYRKDQRGHGEILGEVEKARIAEIFREEIDLLGYRP